MIPIALGPFLRCYFLVTALRGMVKPRDATVTLEEMREAEAVGASAGFRRRHR